MSPFLSRASALAVAILGFSFLAPAVPAHAILAPHTDQWAGGGGTDHWSDPANWVNAQVPQNGDTVSIPLWNVTALQDISGLSLYEIDVTGGNTYNITGDPITIGAGGMNWNGASGGGLVWNPGLVLTGPTPLYLGSHNTVYMNCPITGTGTLAISSVGSSAWMDAASSFSSPVGSPAVTVANTQLLPVSAQSLGQAGNTIEVDSGAMAAHLGSFVDADNYVLNGGTLASFVGQSDVYTGSLTVAWPSAVSMSSGGPSLPSSIDLTGPLHLNASLKIAGTPDPGGQFALRVPVMDGTGNIQFAAPGASFVEDTPNGQLNGSIITMMRGAGGATFLTPMGHNTTIVDHTGVPIHLVEIGYGQAGNVDVTDASVYVAGGERWLVLNGLTTFDVTLWQPDSYNYWVEPLTPVNLTNHPKLKIDSAEAFAPGTQFRVIRAYGEAVRGWFLGYPDGATYRDAYNTYRISYIQDNGVVLTVL